MTDPDAKLLDEQKDTRPLAFSDPDDIVLIELAAVSRADVLVFSDTDPIQFRHILSVCLLTVIELQV